MAIRAADLLPGFGYRDAPSTDPSARLQHFLEHVWGHRALFMRAVMRPELALLDADELAGLACEPDADARIVGRSSEGYWQEAGPFAAERFATLGERDWTLLVNGVDLFLPGFAELLRSLRFVPVWRIDDAMVSFAAPGGSAGPHFDHYDVFLVQLHGTRRWELGEVPDGPTRPLQTDTELSLVADFEPSQVVTCEPGDVLYVPPGLVHHGIAETPCLTLSLGLRGPSEADLLAAWAEHSLATAGSTPAPLDPSLPTRPSRLAAETVARSRELLRAALNQQLDAADFPVWLGTQLTLPSRGMLLAPPDTPASADMLRAELTSDWQLVPAPGVRMLLVADPHGAPVLCAGGEQFRVPGDVSIEVLEAALDSPAWNGTVVAHPELLALATILHNEGWLVLEETEGGARGQGAEHDQQ